MDQRKTLAIFFGGRSSEHEISIISGLQLIMSVDPEKFIALAVYIDPDGHWWTGSELLDKKTYKNFSQAKQKLTAVRLIPEPGFQGLQVQRKKLLGGFSTDTIPFDIAIPVFHGQFGEDGCMQGLFELAAVPYTGSPVGASAAAMNKFLCKQVALGLGVPSLLGIMVLKSEFQLATKTIVEKIAAAKLSYPLFVKPNNLGSSVGVGSAENESELLGRLAAVFAIDTEALVEPMLSDMLELNISVAADIAALATTGIAARPSVIEMPVASKKILTYEDKYLRGGKSKKGPSEPSGSQGMAGLTRVIDPQDIPEETKQTVRENALKLFKALGCGGVGRFDFMLDTKTGIIYFNELNPIPGSMSFYLWEKSSPKLLYPQVIELMVENALQSFAMKATLRKEVEFKAL